MTVPPHDAIVLAGGAARRLGGVDKPGLVVGGRTLLDRVLDVCAGARRTVVAGPRRTTRRAVDWVREEPPGGGPVAGLAAALPRVLAPVVLVLAADLPFAERSLGERLAVEAGRPGRDGAVATDGEGRDQMLFAAYRTSALRAALAEVGDPAGAAMRRLVAPLSLYRVAAESDSVFDCDTWADVRGARDRSGRMGQEPERSNMTGLEEWTDAVKRELGIELDVDIDALLDMARVAAHNVQRPAAPLTAFLVGYAAAGRGGGETAVADALRAVVTMAERGAPAAGTEPAG